MAVRQYIGARYVTKIYENSQNPDSAEWEAGVTYEPLTLVTFNFSSYLSKKEVPGSVGDPASNPNYWVVTGAYNGQIAALQSQIAVLNELLPLKPIYESYKIINVLYPPADTDTPLVNDWITDSSYTDNTTAFQSLIDTYGSGTVFYFPEGIYGFSGSVNIPNNQITIQGNGSAYTRLHFNGSGEFINLGNPAAMNGLLRVLNIGFVCDDVSQSAIAIHLNNPNAPLFEDLLFLGFSEDIRFEAIVASSGQSAEFNWLTHSSGSRTTSDCMFNFVSATASIFPNGIFIDNCHGAFVKDQGRFIKGNVADLVVTRCNIANCKYTIDITAGNPDIAGDLRICNNMFTDCTGHCITIRHFNRAVIFTDNFIEQAANYTGNVFAAFRISDCNGVIISNNCVGTERTSILNHFIAFLLCENTVKDFTITGNVGYLGGYVLTNGTIRTSDFVIANNHFEHIGSNTVQANAFYIGATSNSNIHDNRLKGFSALNSAYNLTGVYTKNNMYDSGTTINLPFVASDNYVV